MFSLHVTPSARGHSKTFDVRCVGLETLMFRALQTLLFLYLYYIYSLILSPASLGHHDKKRFRLPRESLYKYGGSACSASSLSIDIYMPWGQAILSAPPVNS